MGMVSFQLERKIFKMAVEAVEESYSCQLDSITVSQAWKKFLRDSELVHRDIWKLTARLCLLESLLMSEMSKREMTDRVKSGILSQN